jgi:DNA-binding response OmpR family regulator
MAGKRILLVDDDVALRQTLAEQLTVAGEFSAAEAGTGADALRLAKAELFDLILLDVGLPDADGRAVCASLRQAGVSAPVIMLTAKAGEADTIKGLDAGANDYVAKPFKLGVLLARMRAQLRQHERSEDLAFAIGHFTFKPGAKLLLDTERPGKKVRLTDKEAAILKYLYRAKGTAVGRDVLLADVWGYAAGVTTHTLETHIYRLRQKIERDPGRAELLLTEPEGYRLMA